MYIFCDNCGHKNRKEAKFCRGCGAGLLTETRPQKSEETSDKIYNIEDLIKAGSMISEITEEKKGEVIIPVVCSHCNTPLSFPNKFCSKCGKIAEDVQIEILSRPPLTEIPQPFCDRCKIKLSREAVFCSSCGDKVTGLILTPSSSIVEISSGVDCPQCGTNLPPGIKSCPVCNSALA